MQRHDDWQVACHAHMRPGAAKWSTKGAAPTCVARWLNSWAMTASSWADSASASSSPWRLMAAIASSALTLLCWPRTACSTAGCGVMSGDVEAHRRCTPGTDRQHRCDARYAANCAGHCRTRPSLVLLSQPV